MNIVRKVWKQNKQTMMMEENWIFQPDKTKQDFAICRLDKKSMAIKQVAFGVYSVSMSFVETW